MSPAAERLDPSNDLEPEDVREGDVEPGRPLADVDVDVVQRARVDLDADVPGRWLGVGNILVAQHIQTAELVYADRLHRVASPVSSWLILASNLARAPTPRVLCLTSSLSSPVGDMRDPARLTPAYVGHIESQLAERVDQRPVGTASNPADQGDRCPLTGPQRRNNGGGASTKTSTLGTCFAAGVGRTVTRVDNQWFTLLTLNTNQAHFNSVFAESTRFGQPLVNSTFTLALVTGLSVPDTSENAMANLSWTDIKLPSPVFEGDTLWAETEVLERRESKSRPSVGIVGVRTRGINQRSEVVIEFRRSFMVYRRDAPELHDTFPHTDTDWTV